YLSRARRRGLPRIARRPSRRRRLSVGRAVPFRTPPHAPRAARAWRCHRRGSRPLGARGGPVPAVRAAAFDPRPPRRPGARGAHRMMDGIELVLFDIGGVLGSNGWDREQRAAAVEAFHLDADDFQYRHEETVGAFESGQITLDEYLDVTVFCEDRAVSRDDFKRFMFAQSVPWEASIAVARDLARGRVRLATLNNESEELNQYRIQEF